MGDRRKAKKGRKTAKTGRKKPVKPVSPRTVKKAAPPRPRGKEKPSRPKVQARPEKSAAKLPKLPPPSKAAKPKRVTPPKATKRLPKLPPPSKAAKRAGKVADALFDLEERRKRDVATWRKLPAKAKTKREKRLWDLRTEEHKKEAARLKREIARLEKQVERDEETRRAAEEKLAQAYAEDPRIFRRERERERKRIADFFGRKYEPAAPLGFRTDTTGLSDVALEREAKRSDKRARESKFLETRELHERDAALYRFELERRREERDRAFLEKQHELGRGRLKPRSKLSPAARRRRDAALAIDYASHEERAAVAAGKRKVKVFTPAQMRELLRAAFEESRSEKERVWRSRWRDRHFATRREFEEFLDQLSHLDHAAVTRIFSPK